MKYLECSGTPLDMGIQYGEQARNEIRACLDFHRPAWNPQTVPVIKNILNTYAPEILDELKGIALGAEADLNEILCMNHLPAGDECTPVILRNSPDGIIVAKNNDAPPQENLPFVIRKCVPSAGLAFIQLTYAGWLSGFDMMNEAGLANTHGSVGSKLNRYGMRLDIRLRMYQLMQKCRTADELYEKLQDFPLTGKGFSIALGDRDRNCAFIDAAIPLTVARNRNAKFSYSTNLYESPGLENADTRNPDKRYICEYRRGFFRWLEKTAMPTSLPDIKQLLSSHAPWAPCRHGEAHSSVTTWSMICLPESGKVLISHDAPCQSKYEEYHL